LRPVTGFFAGISLILVLRAGAWTPTPGECGNVAFTARNRGGQSGACQAGNRAERGFPIHGELTILAD